MPVVRLAKPVDLEATCRTDPMAGPATARRDRIVRGIDDGGVWVVEVESQIAGYAVMARSFFDRAFIELVVIDPEHRSRGLGPLLITQLEGECPSDELFTSSNASNAHMRHVLGKLGYERSGIIHNLDPGDPEIVYFKRLRGAE